MLLTLVHNIKFDGTNSTQRSFTKTSQEFRLQKYFSIFSAHWCKTMRNPFIPSAAYHGGPEGDERPTKAKLSAILNRSKHSSLSCLVWGIFQTPSQRPLPWALLKGCFHRLLRTITCLSRKRLRIFVHPFFDRFQKSLQSWIVQQTPKRMMFSCTKTAVTELWSLGYLLQLFKYRIL